MDIDVVDGQPYSFGELEERQLTVHKALVAYGFTSVATSVDIVGAGRIPAQVTETPGVDSRPETVLSAMPQGLRPHIDLAVRDEPVTSLEFGFGGERVRGGGSQCTSGWPILANGVLPGITTAGHCDGMNEIDWTDAGLSFPITPQFQHRRAWGDVEYHFGVPVLAGIFYASSADVREARSVEPVAAISLGESVCQYGRSSNVRHCTPDVDSVSVTCTFAPPSPSRRSGWSEPTTTSASAATAGAAGPSTTRRTDRTWGTATTARCSARPTTTTRRSASRCGWPRDLGGSRSGPSRRDRPRGTGASRPAELDPDLLGAVVAELVEDVERVLPVTVGGGGIAGCREGCHRASSAPGLRSTWRRARGTAPAPARSR
ncbi:hypothetical protein ACFSTC_21060 [Nonomuraea ferruginea]